MYVIGGVEMKLPLIVGAGACKTPASILPYMRPDVSVGAICTGSYTPKQRSGNEGKLFYPDTFSDFIRGGFGLNSFGMPNAGFEAAANEFRSQYEHPVIASVAGFSVDELVRGVEIFDVHPGIAATKLNLGCPNTENVPMAYDSGSLKEISGQIERLKPKKPVWLKLSPYITAEKRDALQEAHPHLDFSQVRVVEPWFLVEILSIIWLCPYFRAVVFSNTLGNVIFRKDGKPVTTPNDGRAGLSGSILKPINIDLMRQTAGMLPGARNIDLVGSGGVLHGDDAVDYFEGRAAAVCCTSGPFWSGNDPRFFADFISGSERLQDYLTQYQPKED